MIPLVVPAMLKAVPWRLVGAVALVLAVAAAGWRVSVWRDGYHALQATETALAETQAEVARYAAREASAQQALAEAAGKAKARESADRATAERIEHDLQTRLAAADARGRDLARRLSVAARKTCPGAGTVPGPAEAAAEPDRAGGDASRDAAVAGVFAACERDAVRLAGWQEWWADVSR